MKNVWTANDLDSWSMDEVWDDNVDYQTAISDLEAKAAKYGVTLEINAKDYLFERIQDGSQLGGYQAQVLIDAGIWEAVTPLQALKATLDNLKEMTENVNVYAKDGTHIKISVIEALINKMESKESKIKKKGKTKKFTITISC